VARTQLDIADVFREHGQRWRAQHASHLSLAQLKVMSAIAHCRTALLGGHVLRCQACEHVQISYNSCRNRHCPKCQASSAKRWLEARQTQLLPVDYYHLVFTLPSEVAALAYYNKSVMYDLLMKTAAETVLTIGADPKRVGARLGVTFVLHTWGSAMTHHPHVHGIVPGGGISLDGEHWVSCRSGFFLPVRVLSRYFRRRYLERLRALYQQGELAFFGDSQKLEDEGEFTRWLHLQQQYEWVVYAKRPFAGPEAVLAYLSRYTHRVAMSNSRLVNMDDDLVSFRWKNYRKKTGQRYRTMSLTPNEFIRRFLLHVLPSGFHRIRHYGLVSNSGCKKYLNKARQLLNVSMPKPIETSERDDLAVKELVYICPECSGKMVVLEMLPSQLLPRGPPLALP